MKKILKKVKKSLKQEIEFAHEAGFQGMMVMLDGSLAYIYLETMYDTETLEEIAIENGWDEHCVVLDFAQNSHKVLYIQELVA